MFWPNVVLLTFRTCVSLNLQPCWCRLWCLRCPEDHPTRLFLKNVFSRCVRLSHADQVVWFYLQSCFLFRALPIPWKMTIISHVKHGMRTALSPGRNIHLVVDLRLGLDQDKAWPYPASGFVWVRYVPLQGLNRCDSPSSPGLFTLHWLYDLVVVCAVWPFPHTS